jgi:hypothetical protein
MQLSYRTLINKKQCRFRLYSIYPNTYYFWLRKQLFHYRWDDGTELRTDDSVNYVNFILHKIGGFFCPSINCKINFVVFQNQLFQTGIQISYLVNLLTCGMGMWHWDDTAEVKQITPHIQCVIHAIQVANTVNGFQCSFGIVEITFPRDIRIIAHLIPMRICCGKLTTHVVVH